MQSWVQSPTQNIVVEHSYNLSTKNQGGVRIKIILCYKEFEEYEILSRNTHVCVCVCIYTERFF